MTNAHLLAALLGTTALLAPGHAFAQATPPSSPSASQVGNEQDPNQKEQTADVATPGAADAEPAPGEVEISGPGAGGGNDAIVIRGRFIPDPIRSTPEVVSVLSAEDIARTGDGDIAGALTRVTGLSVVGGRFVYVRGLGERYSAALLNGTPIPSPEPLRRVVPLDLFPTSIIASTVVQKSYSANYPGEFGGGVINLTTRSAPEKGFFSIGAGIGVDTETSLNLGYTYYGGDTDWLGFDDGTRDLPAPLASAFATGERIVEGATFSIDEMRAITASLDNASTNLIQSTNDVPVNLSGDVGFGANIAAGNLDIGLIAVGGLSNSWRTRGGIQQAGTRTGAPGDPDAQLIASSDFDYLATQNRVVLNGLGSLTFKLDDHKLRLTGVYIRDTLKEARASIGNSFDTVSPSTSRPDETLQLGSTSWFERELYDAQAVGEFEFGAFSLDLRGAYAKTRRDAPYERKYSYAFDEAAQDYVNNLRSPGQSAGLSFSELDDELWYGAVDVAYDLPTGIPILLSGGYAYTDNERSAIRRDFEFFPNQALNLGVAQERIDYLLSDYNVYTYDVLLRETTGGLGSAAYDAGLTVNAGYVMAELEPLDGVTLNMGVRYEDAEQSVTPRILFGQPAADASVLANDYWLPAGTLTWNFADDMQVRLSASKTIARPQFRELAPQPYSDTESQRTFFGNQFLVDSEILNLDARYEYYFGRDQILSVAAFYKDIKNPIEATAVNIGSSLVTSFANAPRAELLGAELEFRKYFPLADWGVKGDALSARRLTLITNYTYTQSKVKVEPGDTTISFTSQPNPIDATLVFDTTRDLRLTGQSEHLLNLQFGLEHEDRLSQQTFALTYASDRATNRGPNLTPDFIEKPGVQLDFIWREGFTLGGTELEMKAEARNLLGTRYEEVQELNGSELIINRYDRGRTFNLSLTATL
ncbi:TonB-dependent receptor domain-containing protein [Sphingomicrobium flavum]|uniref:TonB-dependent receptor domain-containing protein n=1 Tax=Sphingomicrobium flavum TaxID=1229164 RepID=UPI0021ADDB31|nr:TonB-dependent receptor [Sphingomicrobium flavum]